MSKKSKSSAAPHVGGTLYAVTGSFAPTDFRFHQGSLAHVEALIAKGTGAVALRSLPSVRVRTHQGYVGTNATAFKKNERNSEDARASREQTNPGSRDIASLDGDKDTLVVVGGIAFVPNYFAPIRSDNRAMTAYQADFVTQYQRDGLFATLARRYLANLVNGAALWRNRYGFTRKTVVTLRSSRALPMNFVIDDVDSADFDTLVEAFSVAAQTKNHRVQLDVAMVVELGFDSEVYPSQPFLDADQKLTQRDVKDGASYSRMLATRLDRDGKGQVILTSNKIGNALRRVDFGYAEGAVEPIAVELFGTVATERVAHRLDNDNDYFKLVETKVYATMTEEERHFIMSVFIKGGLLNWAKEKDE